MTKITPAQQRMLDEVNTRYIVKHDNALFRDWLVARALIEKGLVNGKWGLYERPTGMDYYTGAISYTTDYWYIMHTKERQS